MKLHRSSYYYRLKGLSLWEQKQEADLQDRIEQLVCEFPGYGYRRVTKQLHREGLQVNHKRVLRIMRESSLLCAVKHSYKRTTNSWASLSTIPKPDQKQCHKLYKPGLGS
jgi:hypothetical protein